MKAYAIKALIRGQGAELQRIGRSRNWQLTATFEQLQAIIAVIETAGEGSWLWLVKHLQKQYGELNYQAILEIARMNQGITVNELVIKTNCTIATARKALDEIEFT
ncbi:ribosome recycling factor family protein [Thalassotalea agarivorans]